MPLFTNYRKRILRAISEIDIQLTEMSNYLDVHKIKQTLDPATYAKYIVHINRLVEKKAMLKSLLR